MKKRVLIADDDLAIRESLRKVLQQAGYEVALASDGEVAVQLLTEGKIDLLILDLEMPKLDGWDVFEGVRSRCPSLPVIMITGLAAELETRLIPGLDGLIEKPIEVLPLLKRIEELLGENSQQREMKLRGNLSEKATAGSPGYLSCTVSDWPRKP